VAVTAAHDPLGGGSPMEGHPEIIDQDQIWSLLLAARVA
jgi:hypothetical protein